MFQVLIVIRWCGQLSSHVVVHGTQAEAEIAIARLAEADAKTGSRVVFQAVRLY